MLESLISDLIDNRPLTKTITGQTAGWDLKVAAAAILYAVIEVDHSIERSELEKMYILLGSAFGLSQQEIGRLFALSQKLYGHHDKFKEFLAIINDQYSSEQRATIYNMIWQIIRADKKVDKYEISLAELLQKQLGLSEEQASASRSLPQKG